MCDSTCRVRLDERGLRAWRMRKEVIGVATLYHGDCREILPQVPAAVVITDPVWPNVPEGMLQGSNDPEKLFAEMWAGLSSMPARAVIVLGFDSDPRFLSAVPAALPFIRSQQLPYAFPGYRGRLLAGDEMAYVFGCIPKGRGVIPGRAPAKTVPKGLDRQRASVAASGSPHARLGRLVVPSR